MTEVKNYRDLLFIKENLTKRKWDVRSFKGIVESRKNHFAPIIPDVEETFAILDSSYTNALSRKKNLIEQVELTKFSNDTLALSTKHELDSAAKLELLEKKLKTMKSGPEKEKSLARISFVGYDTPLKQASTKLEVLLSRVNALIEQQGNFINRIVLIELGKRRKKLAAYHIKARFALAESYDKATQKQDKDYEDKIKRESKAKLEAKEAQELKENAAKKDLVK